MERGANGHGAPFQGLSVTHGLPLRLGDGKEASGWRKGKGMDPKASRLRERVDPGPGLSRIGRGELSGLVEEEGEGRLFLGDPRWGREMKTSRERMLSDIRTALGVCDPSTPSSEVPWDVARSDSKGPGSRPAGPSEGSPAPGEGGGPAKPAARADLLDLLQCRIADYQATVLRCHVRALPDCLSERLLSRRVQRLVIPSDLPDGWIPGGVSAGVDVLRDGDPSLISTADLASVDAVVTGCALAMAETGTIALDGGVGQGRRAISLLPDYHLCVVMEEQIVETVPEGIARLRLSSGPAPGPITLISGPSATSDIELIRVEGVHGPRTLDVILVEDH